MRQDIGQMREIAFDLHLKKQRFHQEFLDFMNDTIDDSNQAPQEPVLIKVRQFSTKSSDRHKPRFLESEEQSSGKIDQALRWQRAQNKFQKMV